ncbi:hypothetical protein PoB_006991300 [Plakobranchus ocellatus]|uniref:C2 domain-containing protein n=1 Tax=Plakobranchus ocellatus TaxID=259542 RepID=A0AAV4DGQ8_9GAST|nr:hypothetical protein PoB_006991300 [Plakobranchus ocellatus]
MSKAYWEWKSHKAVDGNKSPTAKSSFCTRTDYRDKNPFWKINFKFAVNVNKVMIYNAFEPSQKGNLRGFNLLAIDDNSNIILNYTENSTRNTSLPIGKDGADVYSVVEKGLTGTPIRSFQLTTGIQSKMINMCEFEVFGGPAKSIYSPKPLVYSAYFNGVPRFSSTRSSKFDMYRENSQAPGAVSLTYSEKILKTPGAVSLTCTEKILKH